MGKTIGPDTVIIDEEYPVRQRRRLIMPVERARKLRNELIRMTLEGKL